MTPSEASRLTYGHPVEVRMPGREPIPGRFVCLKPDGTIGVSTGGGYGYFGAARVEIVGEPKLIRRR